jgi:ferrochelatase
MIKKGILLSNLGSPEAPTPEAVKPYLDQFLMDPYVIDLPYLLRALVVRGIILRKRPTESAHAYSTIWTKEGSPLLVFTRNLTKKVQAIMGEEYSVKFAMRYGNPSFKDVLDEFAAEGIGEVSLLPLYPHWALASTGSTLAHIQELKHSVKVKDYLSPFYDEKRFIDLWIKRVQEAQVPQDNLKTHYLFSYHGIPERHVKKTPGCKDYCKFQNECCLSADAPRLCYRSHCVRTSVAMAKLLNLSESDYTTSFQSRLGPDRWLQPPTDVVLKELPKKGVERLVVLSPAFTADCLETIEELGDRGRDDFIKSGGKDYILVACHNDQDDWAQLVSSWSQEKTHFESFPQNGF